MTSLSHMMQNLFCRISGKRSQCREDKKIRGQLSEKQIDKMVDDSFPASDPPSTY